VNELWDVTAVQAMDAPVKIAIQATCQPDLAMLQQKEKQELLSRVMNMVDGKVWSSFMKGKTEVFLRRAAFKYTQAELRDADVQETLEKQLTASLGNVVGGVGLKVVRVNINKVEPELHQDVMQGVRGEIDTDSKVKQERVKTQSRVDLLRLRREAEAELFAMQVRTRAEAFRYYLELFEVERKLDPKEIIMWEWLHSRKEEDHIPPFTEIGPWPPWGEEQSEAMHIKHKTNGNGNGNGKQPEPHP
jgi:hypothetical protein